MLFRSNQTLFDGTLVMASPSPTPHVETLGECLLRRYKVYDDVWDMYITPCRAYPQGCGSGLIMSRTYTEQEHQEFIRTMAILDVEGQQECKGKPIR